MTARRRSWVRVGAAAAVAALAVGAVPLAAQAEDGYTSIFTDGGLKGAGWGRCSTAIV